MLLKLYDILLQRKISVVRTCDGKVIKVMDCIIKVAIIRGNITWRSFALRAWASKNKKRMTTSASLCEGPIFYFSVFTFMQRVNSINSHFNLDYSLVGKHHVVGRDLGTYDQSNIFDHIVDNYLYDKWVGRRNIKPLSFSVFDGCHLF